MRSENQYAPKLSMSPTAIMTARPFEPPNAQPPIPSSAISAAMSRAVRIAIAVMRPRRATRVPWSLAVHVDPHRPSSRHPEHLPPRADAPRQCPHVREASGTVLFRPPGGRRLVRSSTVEDDLLRPRQARCARLELLEVDRALDEVLTTLLRAVVGAHEQRLRGH